MQKITSSTELKNAIQSLEADRALKGKQLKEQFFLVYESFKPVNVLTNTLNEISRSPYLIDNLLGSVMGLATGFFTRKVFIGASGNKIRRFIGNILQVGITNFVAQYSGSIKSFGGSLFQHIFRKKEMKSGKP